LWLTAIAAVSVAWFIDHTKLRIDWAGVRAMQQDHKSAIQAKQRAESLSEIATQRETAVLKAAARFGITILDIEPETQINRELRNEVD